MTSHKAGAASVASDEPLTTSLAFGQPIVICSPIPTTHTLQPNPNIASGETQFTWYIVKAVKSILHGEYVGKDESDERAREAC